MKRIYDSMRSQMCTSPFLHHCLCKRKKERKKQAKAFVKLGSIVVKIEHGSLLPMTHSWSHFHWFAVSFVIKGQVGFKWDTVIWSRITPLWAHYDDVIQDSGLTSQWFWHAKWNVWEGEKRHRCVRFWALFFSSFFLLHLITKWHIMVRYVQITRDDIANI